MATYAQPGSKRQKTREVKSSDNVDYFQSIDKVEYNNMASPTDTTCYRYYNGTERVHSRPMEDWLKFSVSLTEFKSNGSDNCGRPTHIRTWDDNTNTMDNYKRCIKALFEFCLKLGIKYWTAFDTDLIPHSDNWEENKTHWDEIVDYIQELTQKCHVKLLWLAPDLHSHPRYASGSMTSNDAVTFVQAATQIKKCTEICQRLNAECFLIWPYREGYDAIFQTDIPREIKLFAKLLKVTAEYKERLNYKCQLLIMPYYSSFSRNSVGNFSSVLWQHMQLRENELIHTYMWDVTSCLYFLKCNSLDRHYRVVTPPGHHLYMASVYNMLGGVAITNDIDQSDSKTFALMLKCITDQNTTPSGGVNLKLLPRRDGDLRELVITYVKYMDAVAKGLRLSISINAEQVFAKHLQSRYTTYYSGFGARIVTSDITMEECEEYYRKNNSQQHNEVACVRSEHLDVVFQRYLDTCDHV